MRKNNEKIKTTLPSMQAPSSLIFLVKVFSVFSFLFFASSDIDQTPPESPLKNLFNKSFIVILNYKICSKYFFHKISAPDRNRTHNLCVRSAAPYPLGHRGINLKFNNKIE